jgi:UDP-glucose 4-epimerase
MRVLITGAAGRIGRAICAQLHSTHQVMGLDRVPSPTTQWHGDVGDAVLLAQALRNVDAVVHTAALHAPHVGQVSDAEFDRVNVQGTATLLRLALAAGVRRIVFTSTTALYGAASTQPGTAVWVDEALVPQPRTVYHRSKLAAEALLADAAALHGDLAVTVLRMSRCFAEPAPLMAAYRLHRGVDARDVAQAHVLALQASEPGLRCFVISGATPFVHDDLPALYADAPAVLRRRAPALVEAFHRRGWALPASIDRVCSAARAQHVLGWRPQHGFEEVLAILDRGGAEVLPVSDGLG